MDCTHKKDINRGCCFFRDAGSGEMGASACGGCDKLNTYDWLEEINDPSSQKDIFEVRFKNTRKGYYRNVNDLNLSKGDIVAVESSPGHDIGIISLTGDIVSMQMRKSGFNPKDVEFKKIYRKAKPYDIEKWQEAIALEYPTMISSRRISADLGLAMKIGDVEYQGDKIKAVFYYIADERVDFRELIKIFAEQFKIRVEMKQIGARQEAGRIGGIGSCGRELCCSTWMSNFVSVTTNSARYQDISLNPQKLAGQCSKLKCCLNYEVDSYIDARKEFPKLYGPLETLEGSYYLVKTNILDRMMYFSTDPHSMVKIVPLPVKRVEEIVKINKRGEKPSTLEAYAETGNISRHAEPEFKNAIGEDSITRFDNANPTRRRRKNQQGKSNGQQKTIRKESPLAKNLPESEVNAGKKTGQAHRAGPPSESRQVREPQQQRNNRRRKDPNGQNNRNGQNGNLRNGSNKMTPQNKPEL